MKILKWFLIVLVILAVIIVGGLAYLGVFSKLKVTEQKVGPYLLVYKEFVGPYSAVGKVIKEVWVSCSQAGIKTTKCFGIYLSDPKTTDWDKQRCELGCIVEPKDLKKVKALTKNFKTKTWTIANCLTTEFPIKNDYSYMIGPMKAYPELTKTLTAKKAKLETCMEIYDLPATKILFIFRLGK